MNITSFLSPEHLISTFGLIGIVLIIFAESGLFFGFFFPGDSLLFTAGFIAAQGHLPLIPLIVGTFIAAILGDNVGYWFGKKTGHKLFKREDSFLFHKNHIERAKIFYEHHGKKTIILARFVPVVRTFAPIVAGIAHMKYEVFLFYNVIGGALWTTGFILLGYFLSTLFPRAEDYVFYLIILIILISFIPPIIHVFKKKKV